MKIAYYLYWLDGVESGVIKKIKAQIKLWKKNKHNVKLFVLTKKGSNFDKEKDLLINNSEFEVEIVVVNNFFGYFFKPEIYKKIKLFNPDIIYFRESKVNYSLYKFNKQFKTVIELNSISLNEIENIFSKIFARFSQKIIFNRVSGIVSVTGEILKSIGNIDDKPKIVIGNGIELNAFPTLDVVNMDDKINFVFIGSANQKWHGIDEILKLAKKKPDWFFHLIGMKGNNTNNVFYQGRLNKERYIKIFNKSYIAIGSLALYKNNMDEACPLKVREYLAYGLPVIIGYKDVDFTGQEPFICPIPNKPDNLVQHIDKIEDFVNAWKHKRVPKSLLNNIDIKYKEEKRLDFFNKIIDNNK